MKTNSNPLTRSLVITVCIVAAPLIFAPSGFLQQQGGDFTLYPTVIPAGGGATTACTKRVESSIGQVGLGVSSGSGFAVESGFWPNTLTCPLALSPTTQFFTTAGGSGSVNVVATSSCAWDVSVKADWVSITSSETGTGNDVVTFEVRENFTGSPRLAPINIGGFAQLILQDAGLAADCNYSINPLSQSLSGSGGSGSINVIAEERCAWQAIPTVSWITITSASVGVGSGTVAYCVEANPGVSGRAGTVIIAGKTFAVKQKGS